MKQKDLLQNPWAGLSSYEDPANSDRHLIFCGRDSETFDVARLIDDNFLVTLYGKSGIGKTSLLNAGVFPALRMELYIPLSLRLGMAEDDVEYEDIIITAIEYAVKVGGGSVRVVNVVDEQTDHSAVDYLWNWFARHHFMNDKGDVIFPVVVLDQLEESFRSKEGRRKIENFLRQLHYLIDESHALNDCIVDGENYYYDFNFRFVISIREDDLYRLEDSIDNNSLVSLKQCRYRLRSLSEQGARDVILIPGEGLFQKDEENQIVNTIIDIARNKEDQSISTNLLSLVCNRIFVDFLRKQDADHISISLVDTFIKGNPFERFYNEATKGFSNREKTYIEDHLVDGERRNSVTETNFLHHIRRGNILLEGDTRILQRTSTSSDSSNYRIELIHDSFCAPLKKMKEKRAKRKRLFGIALMAAVSLISLATIAYILSQNHRIQNQKASLMAANERLIEDSVQTVAHIKQIEDQKDSLYLTNTKLESTNNDLKIQKAKAKTAQATAEAAQVRAEEEARKAKSEKASRDSIQRILDKAEANTLEIVRAEEEAHALLENSSIKTSGEKVEKTSSGYLVDGILYPYEQPTQDQLMSWAKMNHQECARKIKSQTQSYNIPSDMIAEAPCLVYLILNSQSIDADSEKQSWFDLWPLMNDEQIFKLYDILYREAYKLASIEHKYEKKRQEINNKYSNQDSDADPEELNNMAYTFARKKEWKEAISTIDLAIKLNPKEANYYDSKGEILMMMGDKQNALKMWKKIMDLDPKFLQKHKGTTPLYEQLKENGLLE